jgi:hypothetical protein
MIESIIALLKIIALCGLCVVAGLFFLMLTIVIVMVIKGLIAKKKQD